MDMLINLTFLHSIYSSKITLYHIYVVTLQEKVKENL
jgi:hypothetical protein